MNSKNLSRSWGKYPRIRTQTSLPIRWRSDLQCLANLTPPLLPFGQGRSYGDSCQNEGGLLLETAPLNRFIFFDQEKGVLRAEAGATLAEILDLIVPRGWFLPVTPGTKFVSLGGAIANDVHGKNHHRDGTFGHHVLQFELARSDGSRLLCSPQENTEWFRATMGGLGLTGLITWAEIQLTPIQTACMKTQSIRFENLDEFFVLSAEEDEKYHYTVAWIDSLAREEALGRGIYLLGNHEDSPKLSEAKPEKTPRPKLSVPMSAPNWLLNLWSIRLFNHLYYNHQAEKVSDQRVHFNSFFYPLDVMEHWNRLYGRRGFLQYQCVVPDTKDHVVVRELLERISRSGCASFLTVLKKFGSRPSPGLLSFPRPGVTLALDFAFEGEKTLKLLESLDEIVRSSQGAVYPAKDARMSRESFQSYFPQWKEFAKYVDPKFSSSFWRRVTL